MFKQQKDTQSSPSSKTGRLKLIAAALVVLGLVASAGVYRWLNRENPEVVEQMKATDAQQEELDQFLKDLSHD